MHAIQLKLHERMNKKKDLKWSYGRNKNPIVEIKKNSRTSRDLQFKEFPLIIQKTRPRMGYERIRKII